MAKSGKVAIVTGSATGLGAACAVDLAGRGWNVAINYTKSKKEADETYEAVKAKGVEAILVQADMGQDADCRKLAAETLKKWGRIDGLINNAGTTKFQNQGDLDGVTPEDFDRILRVNVTGPYMMSRAVYPTMKKQWDDKQERGSIVNISSIAGVMGVGTLDPLRRSKGALNTLTSRWRAGSARRCGSTRCARASSRRAGCWARWARRTTTSCAMPRSRPRRCARPARPSRWPRR